MQTKAAAEVSQFATQQLAHIEAEIAALNQRTRGALSAMAGPEPP